jgi:hypothetical protein
MGNTDPKPVQRMVRPQGLAGLLSIAGSMALLVVAPTAAAEAPGRAPVGQASEQQQRPSAGPSEHADQRPASPERAGNEPSPHGQTDRAKAPQAPQAAPHQPVAQFVPHPDESSRHVNAPPAARAPHAPEPDSPPPAQSREGAQHGRAPPVAAKPQADEIEPAPAGVPARPQPAPAPDARPTRGSQRRAAVPVTPRSQPAPAPAAHSGEGTQGVGAPPQPSALPGIRSDADTSVADVPPAGRTSTGSGRRSHLRPRTELPAISALRVMPESEFRASGLVSTQPRRGAPRAPAAGSGPGRVVALHGSGMAGGSAPESGAGSSSGAGAGPLMLLWAATILFAWYWSRLRLARPRRRRKVFLALPERPG